MTETTKVTRRKFLVTSTTTAGALVLGFYLPGAGRFNEALAAEGESTLIDGWLIITPDNRITIRLASSEMGQGVYTSMPMLIAEELEVGLDQVEVEMAPVAPAFTNQRFGVQATGGSTTVRWSFEPLRRVGAQAREVLRAAGAKAWGVPLAETRAERGAILHEGSGRRATYGVLAPGAAALDPPDVTLKPKSEWKLIGTPARRLDSAMKSTGTAEFGVDVQVEGMLVGTVKACPVFGGKLISVDKSPALAVNGVKDVVTLDDAVIVLADGYWPAKKGLDALAPKWEEGANAGNNDEKIHALLREGLSKSGAVAVATGDKSALADSAQKVEAVYEAPLLAHATMEPMNATADVRADGADLWLPTQGPGIVPGIVANLTGLKPEQVRVHTTFLGGGFGRRFEMDFMVQATLASKLSGAPVKLIWSREEDIRRDLYRPPSAVRLSAGLDAKGSMVALDARICSPSILSRVFPHFVKDGVDNSSVEGVRDTLYSVPNLHVDYVMQEVGVPVGFWRAVGHSQNAFFMEGFIDELAHAANKDPVSFRRELLKGKPRPLALLDRLASEAGWGRAASGRVQGVALHESFGSIVGQVVEASVNGKAVKIHRVTSVVDCGVVVNPDTIAAQVDSSIAYGLTAAWFGEIHVKDGGVVEGNFDTYPMLRLAQMPPVRTFVMDNAEAPGGMGEPALPPIAPALANAVFAATGERHRSLPLSKHGLQPA